MGQRLVALAAEDRELHVGAALDAAGHPKLGQDAGEVAGAGKLGILTRADWPPDVRLDVVIDFSVPEGTKHILDQCLRHKGPLVVATTVHTAAQKAEIEAAAHEIALLFSPNMSLAVNALFALVAQAAGMLKGRDFDVEVLERHHRYKKDSPSGTALQLVRIIQEAMGQTEVRH